MKQIVAGLFLLFSLTATAQDGIKLDSSGVQYGIEIDIAPDPLITVPHTRKARLKSMSFNERLEILIVLELSYYTPSGRSMLEAIDADNTLSPDAKERRRVIFQNYTLPRKTTEGSLVDVATKQVLVGPPVSGRTYIPEILLYQVMTRADLQGLGVAGAAMENRPLQLIYKMLVLQVKAILTRNGFTP